MKEVPLFIYDEMPKPMKRYLNHFGWRFNKAACMYAISKMWRKDSQGKKMRIKQVEKAQVDELLKKHNVDLENKELYDYVYAYHMVMADLTGVSVDDEKHVMLSVKAIVDDPDKPGGNVFWHWYWDEVYAGRGVEFEDFMDGSDIRQRFRLDKFDWTVTVYYAVHGYYVEDIVDELRRIGLSGEKLETARENLEDREVNSGLTYVNNGEAVCVIGIASSADEYADSIQHEVMHLALFIGKAEGLDPFGEEVCYMGGEIARKMWPKTKLLTSECGCYTKRIGKVL